MDDCFGLYKPDENGDPPTEAEIRRRAAEILADERYLHDGRRDAQVRLHLSSDFKLMKDAAKPDPQFQ